MAARVPAHGFTVAPHAGVRTRVTPWSACRKESGPVEPAHPQIVGDLGDDRHVGVAPPAPAPGYRQKAPGSGRFRHGRPEGEAAAEDGAAALTERPLGHRAAEDLDHFQLLQRRCIPGHTTTITTAVGARARETPGSVTLIIGLTRQDVPGGTP